MENLDLDVNNYSMKDLESFFKLNPKNKEYSIVLHLSKIEFI
jgi:hypothetical protein